MSKRMIVLTGVEKYGAGSSPSGTHHGGWEGLGKDGGESAPHFPLGQMFPWEVIQYLPLAGRIE